MWGWLCFSTDRVLEKLSLSLEPHKVVRSIVKCGNHHKVQFLRL
ncbi:hypothetical protein LEP1GSC083_2512 [Leptospira interrogans serovar Pyrogenes str. L0374]|uniref:Uncharacterized protein n=5 Tax=Leptospira interrogans TaxID=173 RepID=M6ZDP4_LEPIR|nr:hypothetical protein G436_0819 [Leptospira interrogans serovar Hardjo str. Norma]EKO04703.1 hypothetical protein LEP1GSC077_3906 [Leptospira interrogans str. C10069]EKO26951.1 hypothetical protein LEP1GSC104_1107 [Leptospira interrogans str. UI 12621]EKO97408.1 hypothetical protein LEP1GSC057_3950 [Leptospira interrogans str. Brem 329]EMG19542.1 hypothetical protein LEP1GSC150_4174 [Leptospira interrogans serovar Copenhageni str. LT2050]EMN29628.1 hypothetical protein LEP1GSC083_2512 [Lepto